MDATAAAAAAAIDFSADLPPCHDVTINCCANGNDLCVTIAAADRPSRSPTHCILVLDISGSMNSEASLPDPNANPDEAQVCPLPPPSPPPHAHPPPPSPR